MYQTDIHKQHIYIIGVTEECRCASSDINMLRTYAVTSSEEWLRPVYAFLVEWFSESSYIEVQTSGSTGEPKRMRVEKHQMMLSAIRTCDFLKLKEGDTALLCMDMRYIGAKMMVVRALVCGMNLVVRKPSGHPLCDVTQTIDFLSVVPLQLYNTLNTPEERQRLDAISRVIVGGGAVEDSVCALCREVPGRIYSTYGMTETLSHVALRLLNCTDATTHFVPLQGVKVMSSEQGTLVINDTLLGGEDITTNDVGTVFSDGTFVVHGRADNVVNSGGVKIQLEEDEAILRTFIHVPFALTAIRDARLGEALVLLVDERCEKSDNELIKSIKESLPPYHIPRHIFRLEEIPLSGNGKLNRKECRRLADAAALG